MDGRRFANDFYFLLKAYLEGQKRNDGYSFNNMSKRWIWNGGEEKEKKQY